MSEGESSGGWEGEGEEVDELQDRATSYNYVARRIIQTLVGVLYTFSFTVNRFDFYVC